MEKRETLREQNAEYWNGRAASYSDVNKWELAGESRDSWKAVIGACVSRHFGIPEPGGKARSGAGPAERDDAITLDRGPARSGAGPAERGEATKAERRPADLRVLDIGCGPGFFAVILTELGYQVTAVDMSEEMLAEARLNAGALADLIEFRRMDAEALDFPGESFDVVISRNLTWDLPHPDKAYAEWHRVIRPGGLLINFDSNWYHYLYDEEKRAAYQQDRARSEELALDDQNVGEDFDVMEDIAREMPLSRIDRPAWDIAVLTGLGLDAAADTEVWQKVWTEQEKINFASTPMFMIRAEKKSR